MTPTVWECSDCQKGDPSHDHRDWMMLPKGSIDQAVVLLEFLRDGHPDPCSFDHHGYCQEHGWLDTDCPMPTLDAVLEATGAG